MSKTFLEPRRGKPWVLALDIGKHLGWASYREDGHVAHGMADLTDGGIDGHGRQLLRLRYLLGQYIEQMVPMNGKIAPGQTKLHGCIAFENVEFQGPNGLETVHYWGAVWGNILSFGELWGLPCLPYATGAVKRAMTGHGDAPKDAAGLARMNASRAERKRPIRPYTGPTIEQAVATWGFETTDHNERDALAILKAHLDAEAALGIMSAKLEARK